MHELHNILQIKKNWIIIEKFNIVYFEILKIVYVFITFPSNLEIRIVETETREHYEPMVVASNELISNDLLPVNVFRHAVSVL